MYEAWLAEVIHDNDVRSRFETLRGKTLGCWRSAREACHADVIIRMLDEADN